MVYVLIIAALALLPDLYIWNSFIKGGNILWSMIYWIPSTVLLIAPVVSLSGHWQNFLLKLFLLLLLGTVIPKCVFALFSLIGKGAGYLLPAASTVGNVMGIIAALFVLAAVGYGFTKGWKRITVKEVGIASSDIPAGFEGYTIVQLSDFHIGTYATSPRMVDEIIEKVNGLHPDAIVFTGDLVNSSPHETTLFMNALSRMKAQDGIFSILGNHDYCEYHRYAAPDSPRKSLDKLIKRERMLGWQVLLNEHRLLHRGADTIAIIGVENDGEPPFPSRADLAKAMSGMPDSIFKILLSHDPSHWRRSVLPETNIQLTLSGHTHAMQLKLGSFSPAKWKYPEWGGLYREDGRMLHVSTGVGSNVPFRLGAWPEINVIRLYSTKK